MNTYGPFSAESYGNLNSTRSILYGSKEGFHPFASLSDVDASKKTQIIHSRISSTSAGTNRIGFVNDWGDFNGDGAADLILGDSLFFSTAGSRKAFLTVDDVDGGFGVPAEWGIYFADVNHDGFDDIIRRYNYGVLLGKSLRSSGLPDIELVVRQLDNDFQLLWQQVSNASVYRISVDGVFREEIPASQSDIVLINPGFIKGTIISIEALDLDGVFLARTLRRLDPMEKRVDLSARIYSKNQLELYMNYSRREGPKMILRNGKILNENNDQELGYWTWHDGRKAYVDRTIMSGETYSYTVIPDFRLANPDDLTLLDIAPSKQFRSNTVTVTIPNSLSNNEPLADRNAITYVVEDQTIHWIVNVIEDPTIDWIKSGIYQVLDADDYTEVCGEANDGFCNVTPGVYILIELSSNQRVRVVVPDGEDNSIIAPVMVSDNIISWPDDGWYQVLNQKDYSEVCAGGRSCQVPRGSYIVINHTTKKRITDVQVQF